MPTLTIGGDPLTLEDLVGVARENATVALAPSGLEQMGASAEWVRGVVESNSRQAPLPVYGINTGFGSLAGRRAFGQSQEAVELSRRVVLSTAAGIGRYLDADVVRAAMLVRAHSLARGLSGVRVEVVETLVAMLNRGVLPAVPEYGSLGASGDLIPLAHVALVMSRGDQDESGEALLDGTVVSGAHAMERAGIERLVLGPKEGIALLNGTSFSTALCALALADAERLVATSEVALAMSAQALLGFHDAFLPGIHAARGHQGQIESAAHVRALLAGTQFLDGASDRDPKRQPPQDAYSLRCAPQVLGSVRDTLRFVRTIVETELHAVTDNPLILLDLERPLKAVSGGNFHAQYLAFASDFLAIATTEVGSIAERRLFRLDDGTLSRGLPDMLIDAEPVGIDCGFMLPQYLAAGLVSDCKTLAHPDSVDSIPTCANQEDHVSMAMNAGRHARQVVANVEAVVAVELLMAAQALDLRLREDGREPTDLSPATRAVLELIRAHRCGDGRTIDYLTRDTVLYPRIRAAIDLVHSGAVLEAARAAETTEVTHGRR